MMRKMGLSPNANAPFNAMVNQKIPFVMQTPGFSSTNHTQTTAIYSEVTVQVFDFTFLFCFVLFGKP